MTLARFAGRGYPCPIAGRSRMPSWHPLTQTGPRFGILPSPTDPPAADRCPRSSRLLGHGQPRPIRWFSRIVWGARIKWAPYESSGEAHGWHGWPAGCLGRFCAARRMRQLRPRRRCGDFPAASLPRFGGWHLFPRRMRPTHVGKLRTGTRSAQTREKCHRSGCGAFRKTRSGGRS